MDEYMTDKAKYLIDRLFPSPPYDPARQPAPPRPARGTDSHGFTVAERPSLDAILRRSKHATAPEGTPPATEPAAPPWRPMAPTTSATRIAVMKRLGLLPPDDTDEAESLIAKITNRTEDPT